MGAHCFKGTNGNNTQSPRQIENANTLPREPTAADIAVSTTKDDLEAGFLASIIKNDLKAYVKACTEDSELQDYNANIFKLTKQAINSFAVGDKEEPLSLDSLVQVTDSLIQMNQQVVNFIVRSKADAWDDEGFSSLVSLYFESSKRILDFCNALENGVVRAKLSLNCIRRALREFEEERGASHEGDDAEGKYRRTQEQLRIFREAGKPFKDDFFMMYDIVYKEQVTLLEELHKQQQELGKKVRNIVKWKKASNIVFVTAFGSVVILSLVAAAISMPPAVPAVAGVLLASMGTTGAWCSGLWEKYEELVKEKKKIVDSMFRNTMNTKAGMENVLAFVNSTQTKILPLLDQAEDAAEAHDENLKNCIDEIEKELRQFVNAVEGLSEHAATFIKDVTDARRLVIRFFK